MNKITKRSWIVSVLSLAALFLVYKNVILPFAGESSKFETPQFVDGPSLSSGSGLSENSSEPALGSAIAVTTASLDYQFNDSRDPFSRNYQRDEPILLQQAVPHGQTDQTHTQPAYRPVLTAVMMGSGHKYALIDSEVVSEGESVNGLLVRKITKDTVYFDGIGGEFIMQLTTTHGGQNDE